MLTDCWGGPVSPPATLSHFLFDMVNAIILFITQILFNISPSLSISNFEVFLKAIRQIILSLSNDFHQCIKNRSGKKNHAL